ncbi:MAG: ferritin-like domain-containing protein [Parvularculaceae bacterium]
MGAVPDTLLAAAVRVLTTPDPVEKASAAAKACALLSAGAPLGEAVPPDAPARPATPELVPPSAVPRRRLGTLAGRISLLHALAHIEFNAIDLAFDMAARFVGQIADAGLDARAFVADWFGIGAEEARHFLLVGARLNQLGSRYGALPAHGGLWEAAVKTRHDVLARLAIAPLILEARGLDVTPEMIDRLREAGDPDSASPLETIYREEVGHVACGVRWFEAVCAKRALDPAGAFRTLREQHFPGQLKPPFNHCARALAGIPRDFYEPLGNENTL